MENVSVSDGSSPTGPTTSREDKTDAGQLSSDTAAGRRPEDHSIDDSVVTMLDELPEELKLKILSFVPARDLRSSVTPLNSSWKTLSNDSSLWHSVVFTPSDGPDVVQRVLTRFASVVRRVRLQSGSKFTDTLVSAFVSRVTFSRLTVEPVVTSTLSLTDAFWLLQLSRNLESLSLRHFIVPEIPVGVQLDTGPPCPLISLNLAHCRGITDNAFMVIVQHCPLLQWLDIDLVEYLSCESIQMMADNLRHLRALFIDGEQIDDNTFRYVLKKYPKLEAFGVSYAREMSNRTFLLFADMPELQYLKIRHGEHIGVPTIRACFQARRFKRLKTLNLQYCDALDDDAVVAIAGSCPNLEWFVTEFFDAGDDGMSALVDSCPQLRALYLAGGWKITGRPWLTTIGEKLPKLEYIDFTMCTLLDTECFDAAASDYPRIVMSNYYRNVLISEYEELKGSACTFMEMLSDNPSLEAINAHRVAHPNLVLAVLRDSMDTEALAREESENGIQGAEEVAEAN